MYNIVSFPANVKQICCRSSFPELTILPFAAGLPSASSGWMRASSVSAALRCASRGSFLPPHALYGFLPPAPAKIAGYLRCDARLISCRNSLPTCLPRARACDTRVICDTDVMSWCHISQDTPSCAARSSCRDYAETARKQRPIIHVMAN